jgi:hypothetical protein
VTRGKPAPTAGLEDILSRLEAAKGALIETVEGCPSETFAKERAGGESVKKTLERAVDEVNFYYGQLASRALNLPQPPCMSSANFSSIREAAMSLQVAHRRFGNLLHDLIPEDLERTATDDHATYTLRQALEMAAAHYNRRAQQLREMTTPRPRRKQAPKTRPR